MKENNLLLVSVKSKIQSQSQGRVYVVSKEDISSFVNKILDGDSILLIDSVDSFIADSETLTADKTL